MQAPGIVPHPMHDELLSELVLFSPPNVQAVLTAYGWFRDVRHKLEQVRSGVLPSGPDQDQELQKRARYGVRAVSVAYRALLDEGGLPPTGSHLESTKPGDQLGPSPFGHPDTLP